MAREIKVNRESVRLIAKNELGLRAFKLQKGQHLTDENKSIRQQRCKQLLRRAGGDKWEKFFSPMKNCSQSSNLTIISHRHNAQSVMVWADICSTGKTPLVFIDKDVKINLEIYRSEILEAVVLPWT